MKEVKAYMADCNRTDLFKTEQDARRYEFKNIISKIYGSMGAFSENELAKQFLSFISGNLINGIYPAASDAFLEAAEYLKEHRKMLMTGKVE